MSSHQKVPKLNDRGVHRIRVQEAVYTTWVRDIDGDRFELYQINPEQLALKKNDLLTPVRFKLYEQTIRNLKLQRNGYCPSDRRFVYYVVDDSGRRWRYLYFVGRHIGTQRQLQLRYPVQCMSRAQRAAYKIRYDRRRARRARARERQRQRQLASYRAKMVME
jgi:hypothetical protein